MSKITLSLLISPVLRQVTRVSNIQIYKSFDDGYKVQGVFLDISKAFNKVWHQGLHYKLRQSGISGKPLNTLTDFLDNGTQRAILNGQYSSLAKVEAGVPQGSILGSLLFLIYINDLSKNLASNPKTPHYSL